MAKLAVWKGGPLNPHTGRSRGNGGGKQSLKVLKGHAQIEALQVHASVQSAKMKEAKAIKYSGELTNDVALGRIASANWGRSNQPKNSIF